MTMNINKQISKLTQRLKSDKNDDHLKFSLPPYTDALYQSAKMNKDIYSEIYKKMANVCVINYNIEDKKAKKNSWEILSNITNDSEKKCTDDILTKKILTASVKAFDDLALSTKEFEKSLSVNVIKYFQDLSEDSSLTNMKKVITSLSKDMKANSEKVQSLQEQINNQSNDFLTNRKSMNISDSGSTENKLANALLAEESSEKELDTKKDVFLTKLFCSEADQIVIAEKMLEFFKEHLSYYIECKNVITKYIPELQSIIDNNRINHVFNLNLEEHVASTNRKLSYVLETCIRKLDNEEALQEEGLFRISGSKNKLELLKNALNVMRVDDTIIRNCDSAVFAGVLKQYLRELPIPLMTFALYDKWCEVGSKIKQNDVDGAKNLIKECFTEMPSCYYDNLVYLMQFLKKIAENELVNKMNSSNLALMLGPNLIRNKSASDNGDMDASRALLVSPGPTVVEFMITSFYDIFPDVPVYIASKSKVQGKSQSLQSCDKDFDKPSSLKSPRSNADNSSLSSAELLLEDSASSINDSISSLKVEPSLKPPKDAGAILRPKPPRKPLAPPPPMTKTAIPEIDKAQVGDEMQATGSLDNRPKVKKRTSILEKSFNDKITTEAHHTEGLSRSSTISAIKSPPSVPSAPSKRVTAAPITENRTKLENVPPKRPNNPPPPIPSFDKLKETLDLKNPENMSKNEPKKLFPVQENSKPDNVSNSNSDSVKIHHYPKSDTNNQSTLF